MFLYDSPTYKLLSNIFISYKYRICIFFRTLVDCCAPPLNTTTVSYTHLDVYKRQALVYLLRTKTTFFCLILVENYGDEIYTMNYLICSMNGLLQVYHFVKLNKKIS